MTLKVDMANENTTVQEISAKLFAGDFNGLPVVDDNNLVVGIVTAIDVLKAIQKGKALYKCRAKDIMTPNPSVVKKDTDLDEIIDIMIEKGIIMVPVVEHNTNKILGIVSRLDIITEKLKEEMTP
jgi:predicted transcriptional regulator